MDKQQQVIHEINKQRVTVLEDRWYRKILSKT